MSDVGGGGGGAVSIGVLLVIGEVGVLCNIVGGGGGGVVGCGGDRVGRPKGMIFWGFPVRYFLLAFTILGPVDDG